MKLSELTEILCWIKGEIGPRSSTASEEVEDIKRAAFFLTMLDMVDEVHTEVGQLIELQKEGIAFAALQIELDEPYLTIEEMAKWAPRLQKNMEKMANWVLFCKHNRNEK